MPPDRASSAANTASRSQFTPGQVWRSKQLSDYRVTLVRPVGHGTWIIEPRGSSAFGSYTVNEDALRRPDLYELEADSRV